MTPDELTAKREKEKKSLALNYALVVGGLCLLGYSFFFATVSLLIRCVPWHPSHAPLRLPPLQIVALLSTLAPLLGMTPTIFFSFASASRLRPKTDLQQVHRQASRSSPRS